MFLPRIVVILRTIGTAFKITKAVKLLYVINWKRVIVFTKRRLLDSVFLSSMLRHLAIYPINRLLICLNHFVTGFFIVTVVKDTLQYARTGEEVLIISEKISLDWRKLGFIALSLVFLLLALFPLFFLYQQWLLQRDVAGGISKKRQ